MFTVSWLLLLDRGHVKWPVACLHGVELIQLEWDHEKTHAGWVENIWRGEEGRQGWQSGFQKKHVYLVDSKLHVRPMFYSILLITLVLVIITHATRIEHNTWRPADTQQTSMHAPGSDTALLLAGVAVTKHRKRKPMVVLWTTVQQWLW